MKRKTMPPNPATNINRSLKSKWSSGKGSKKRTNKNTPKLMLRKSPSSSLSDRIMLFSLFFIPETNQNYDRYLCQFLLRIKLISDQNLLQCQSIITVITISAIKYMFINAITLIIPVGGDIVFMRVHYLSVFSLTSLINKHQWVLQYNHCILTQLSFLFHL